VYRKEVKKAKKLQQESTSTFDILRGDVLEQLKELPENYFDASFADPPYGLSFMEAKWDHGVPSVEVWKELYRVLKPGAFILMFGGTRTFHRQTCAIEDAGFEIRDTLVWMYGDGYPKSHNIGQAIAKRSDERSASDIHNVWEERGTALKPAWEPCVLAMKPCDGTFAANALKWRVAGLNVRDTRVGKETILINGQGAGNFFHGSFSGNITNPVRKGRWPANLLVNREVGRILDNQKKGASRFFYCPKASKKERNGGLKGVNNHPCLKPIDLCRYLALLLLPPAQKGQTRRLLIPFSGSGSEMIGALLAGWDHVTGIEIDPRYTKIARARIEHWTEENKVA